MKAKISMDNLMWTSKAGTGRVSPELELFRSYHRQKARVLGGLREFRLLICPKASSGSPPNTMADLDEIIENLLREAGKAVFKINPNKYNVREWNSNFGFDLQTCAEVMQMIRNSNLQEFNLLDEKKLLCCLNFFKCYPKEDQNVFYKSSHAYRNIVYSVVVAIESCLPDV